MFIHLYMEGKSLIYTILIEFKLYTNSISFNFENKRYGLVIHIVQERIVLHILQNKYNRA